MGRYLGISCDFHDAAAAVCVDGHIVAAAEEERFSRVKHDARLPESAVVSCLAIAGLAPDDLDAVAFYEKPLDVLGRFVATRQRQGVRSWRPFVRDVATMIETNLMVGDRIDRMLRRAGGRRRIPIAYVEHHLSHAAAAFYPSPFDTAAVLTIDGVGEWATTSIGRGGGRRVELAEEVRFPNSLGLLYSLITTWCGFRPNDGEFKLMGLAPFGEPRFVDSLESIITLQEGGGFRIDARRVGWWAVQPRRLRHLVTALDGPPRRPDEPLTAREADLAASIQAVLERAVLGLARRARDLTAERNLCLGGGVALNCVANGVLDASGIFDSIWVQPAAGDAGSAIGAALWLTHQTEDRAVTSGDGMRGAALGPCFSPAEIGSWLERRGIAHRRIIDRAELTREVASRIAKGEVVGWFEGRMEFGPRALGHRSILADPRSPTMQRDLNVRVKGREGFRPFAPAVPVEEAAEWFAIDEPAPYMLRTVGVREDRLTPIDDEPDDIADRVRVPRSTISACTHVDGSARVQTVDRDVHPRFHALLVEFGARTGCPVLLNTSFNVADEPIVCTPSDAYDTAVRARLDLLVMEDCLVDLSGIA